MKLNKNELDLSVIEWEWDESTVQDSVEISGENLKVETEEIGEEVTLVEDCSESDPVEENAYILLYYSIVLLILGLGALKLYLSNTPANVPAPIPPDTTQVWNHYFSFLVDSVANFKSKNGISLNSLNHAVEKVKFRIEETQVWQQISSYSKPIAAMISSKIAPFTDKSIAIIKDNLVSAYTKMADESHKVFEKIKFPENLGKRTIQAFKEASTQFKMTFENIGIKIGILNAPKDQCRDWKNWPLAYQICSRFMAEESLFSRFKKLLA